MDQIQHKHLDINGLKLHVAQVGTGDKVAIFLHGFPEIWYSWRHQMLAISRAGYRAIAPDFRGYGLSQIPSEPEKTTYQHLADDIIGILDHLGITKAVLVGTDFGAQIVYSLAISHPERVSGVVTIGIPFIPMSFVGQFYGSLSEGYYILRWMTPGRAEADFGRFDVKTVIKNIYILFAKSDVPVAEENQEIMDLVDPSTPLPAWFTEEDLSIYTTLYEKSGFSTPLTVPYRAIPPGVAKESSVPNVAAPALLIMGGSDYFLKFPGMEQYMTSGAAKQFVPNLEITFIDEGSHFVQEQFPDAVNDHLLSFLAKHA